MVSKFRSDTAVYGLAQVVERLISFFLLPLLTKATSAEEFGIWSQLIVVAGISTPIVLLGLQTALVRYLPRWRDAIQVHYSMVLSAFITVTGVLLLMTIGFAFFQKELGVVFFGASGYAMFVLLLAGFILTEAFFELLVAVLRAGGSIRRIAYYLLIKSAVRIGVFLFVLGYLEESFQNAVFSFVVCQLCFVLLLICREMPVRSIAQAGLRPSRPYWGETFRFALPMVVLALLTGLNNSVDRFFLTHLLGVHAVAVYAAAYSLAGIAGFFYSVLGFSLFPAMSACWAEGRKEAAAQLLGKTMQVYLFFLLPFILALGICGPEILVFLATQQYHMHGLAFFLLAAAVGFFGLYQVGVYAVILEGRSVDTMRLMGVTVMISMVLNGVFVPLWGVTGAALATCVANGLLALRTSTMALRILPLPDFHGWLLNTVARSCLMGLLLLGAKIVFVFDRPAVLITALVLAGGGYLAMDYWGRNSALRLLVQRG